MNEKSCSECGTIIPEGAESCPNCGNPVTDSPVTAEPSAIICSECGTVIPEGAESCHNCGNPVSVSPAAVESAVKYCGKCGTKMEPDQQFCPNCGTKSGTKKKGNIIVPIIAVIIVVVIGVLAIVLMQPKVESISVPQSSVEIEGGETFQAICTITPEKAAQKTETVWESNNEAVATVTETGLITAAADGTAQITVTAKDKSATIFVTVLPKIESISVPKSSVEIKGGETFQAICTITPEKAAQKTETVWESNNEAVATVTETGLITAVSDGTAQITVTAGDKSASISVKVKTGPDFKAVYNEIGGDGYYAKLANDGSYISIDTNPLDIDDYTAISAWNMIAKANRTLGFPESTDEKMKHTSAMSGRQTDTHKGVTVSWTYHPDHGLQVTYEKLED